MCLRWDAAPWLLVLRPLLATARTVYRPLSIRTPVVVDDDITLDIHY